MRIDLVREVLSNCDNILTNTDTKTNITACKVKIISLAVELTNLAKTNNATIKLLAITNDQLNDSTQKDCMQLENVATNQYWNSLTNLRQTVSRRFVQEGQSS